MHNPGDYICIQFALIDSEKIGNLMSILCDPVALSLIFVCLVPKLNAIKKKKKKKKKKKNKKFLIKITFFSIANCFNRILIRGPI